MQPTAPLQRALRRLALTTKQGPHNYYKGNRTGAMGRHTKYGTYIIDWNKVRSYVCPDLTNFTLTPFVPRTIETKEKKDRKERRNKKGEFGPQGPMDGQLYLQRWKELPKKQRR